MNDLTMYIALAVSALLVVVLAVAIWASRFSKQLIFATAGLLIFFVINILFYTQVLLGVRLVPLGNADLSSLRSLAGILVIAPYAIAECIIVLRWRWRGN